MNPTLATTGPVTYPFDRDRTDEERRLIAQARLFEPLTEALLREAGLGQGMHVVDLGAGAGDTALLASRLVGPSGSVLGLERSAESVALARRRIADAGIANITFREADVTQLDDVLAGYSGIDAVIGRLILMWVPDPVAVVRACAHALAPGGLVCFLDADLDIDLTMPRSPLWEDVRGWVVQGLEAMGAQPRMGPLLHRTFVEAGMPTPQLQGRSEMFGPQQAPAWMWVNALRGALPTLESLGIVSAEEVDVDTLEARMLAELAADAGVMILPTFTAAWARVPVQR